jgi:hypothetical protein
VPCLKMPLHAGICRLSGLCQEPRLKPSYSIAHRVQSVSNVHCANAAGISSVIPQRLMHYGAMDETLAKRAWRSLACI